MTKLKKVPDNSFFTMPRQSLRKRKEFHNALSHALRSPLVGAMGYVEYLFKGYAGELETEQIAQLALARESIMRLTGTIDAILDSIAFDLRLVQPGTGRCVTQELVEQISPELRDIFRQKKVQLKITMNKRPLVCGIEGHWLQSMIYEMAAAMLRLSRKNSAARLTVRAEKKRRVTITLETAVAPEAVTPPSELFVIFSPLRRVRDTDTSRRGGMGLCLAQKIAENHHGKMAAEYTTGSRHTLRIRATLPLEEAKAQKKEASNGTD